MTDPQTTCKPTKLELIEWLSDQISWRNANVILTDESDYLHIQLKYEVSFLQAALNIVRGDMV